MEQRGASEESKEQQQQENLRKGVYVAKTKEEESVIQLKEEVASLKAALERERAQRFHDSLESKSKWSDEAAQHNEEFARLSRQLHEDRVKHKAQLDTARKDAVAEVVEQVQKRRGSVFVQLNEELRASLQAQLNKGEGELFERAVIAARASVERDLAEHKPGAAYDRIRAAIRLELEEEAARGEGALFERVERAVRQDVEARDRAKLEKALVEAAEREHALAARFRQDLEKLQEKLKAEHESLREQLSRSADEQQQAFLASYAHKVDAVSEEWLAKWHSRETGWRRDLQGLEEARNEARENTACKLENQGKELANNLLKISTKGAEDALKRLDAWLESVHGAQAAHEQAMREAITSATARLNEALEVQQRGADRHQAETLAVAEEQVEAMKTVLRDEQAAYLDSVEKLKQAHEGERAALQDALKSERIRIEQEKQSAVQDIRAQHALLTNAQVEQHAAMSKRLIDRETDLMRREAELTARTAQLQTESREAAERAAQDKWQQVLEEALEQQRAADEQLRQQAVKQVEARYERMLARMESNFEAATSLRDGADAEWAAKMVTAEEQAREREERFKKVCRALFEKRMDTYQKECDLRFRAMHDQMLQRVADQAEARCEAELQLERARVEAEQQRQALAQRMREEARDELVEAERRHAEAVKALGEELAQTQAHVVHLQRAHASEMSGLARHDVNAAAQLFRMHQEAARDKERRAAGSKVMAEHREHILELWGALRMQASEYGPFLLKLFERVPYSPAVQALFEQQVHVLGAKVPLLKKAAQREALKHELRAVQQNAQTEKGRMARDVLLGRLGAISDELAREVDAFRHRFRGERLTYHGVDYWLLLQQEREQMTDVVLARGALGAAEARAAHVHEAEAGEFEL